MEMPQGSEHTQQVYFQSPDHKSAIVYDQHGNT